MCLRVPLFAFDIYILFLNKLLSMKSLFEGLIICVSHLYLILLQNLPVNIFSYSTTKSSRRNLCVKMKTKKFPYMLKSFFFILFVPDFKCAFHFTKIRKRERGIVLNVTFAPQYMWCHFHSNSGTM